MHRGRFTQVMLLLVAIVVLASGCGASGPAEVSGVMVDPNTGMGADGVPIRLMTVLEDAEDAGVYVMVDESRAVPVEDSGIETETDSNGGFTLEEVPPGEYVLIAMVGQPYVLRDEEGETLMIELSAGERLNVGEVSVQQ